MWDSCIGGGWRHVGPWRRWVGIGDCCAGFGCVLWPEPARAHLRLLQAPYVERVEVGGLVLEFDYAGTEEEFARLLVDLGREGLLFNRVEEVSSGLDRLFFHMLEEEEAGT